MAVGELCVLFLDVTAVRRQDAAQVPRSGAGVHMAREAFSGQQGQVAATVQMRLGQQDRRMRIADRLFNHVAT